MKREHVIPIRLSTKEWWTIKEAAEREMRPACNWVRYVALRAAGKAIQEAEHDEDNDHEGLKPGQPGEQ